MSDLKEKLILQDIIKAVHRNHFMSRFQFLRIAKVHGWEGVRFEILHCKNQQVYERFLKNPYDYTDIKALYFVINFQDKEHVCINKLIKQKKLKAWLLSVTPYLRLENAKQKC
jgi:hypothetical protein